jgi:uncharacterized protein YuzE
MKLTHHLTEDLLYIEFDPAATCARNEDLSERVVLDVTEDRHIAGIEILDPSKVLKLEELPVEFARPA